MEKERKIKAVVFDVDGTLYPNSCMIARSVRFFFSHPLISLAFNQLRKDVRQFGGVEDLHLAQVSLAAGYLRIPAEKAEYLIEEYIYGQYMSMFRDVKPFPCIEPMLEEFRNAGLKLGVISDFPIRNKLSYLGLDRFWDAALSADEAGSLKPDSEPFLMMAEELGISPENIIYVGNNYKYDIIGSKGAGMLAAHFSKKEVPGSIADITFSDYNDLRRYVLGFGR